MKLERLSPSMSVLNYENGVLVLFSYETPVAAIVHRNGDGFEYIKSEKFISKTTSNHVKKWLKGHEARVVPHAEIEKLLEDK